MAIAHYESVNGIARNVIKAYDSVNGVARNRVKAYDGVDGVARLFFAPESGNVVLEVEKVTSDTYANSTTYTAEEFILLDIYPKTGGTVNVTYGGLTKTITDTSGAEEPNAQQVFFGTFNGVSDSVATPSSGELTITGDYLGFNSGMFNEAKIDFSAYSGIVDIKSFGNLTDLRHSDVNSSEKLTSVVFKHGITAIGSFFNNCKHLESVVFPASLINISTSPFNFCNINNPITLNPGNPSYKIDGNCLIEISTNTLVSGFLDSVIPSYITRIGECAFYGYSSLRDITIPKAVTSIGNSAFYLNEELNLTVLATTPPTLEGDNVFYNATFVKITVPKGCGATYKAATGWSACADYIVEAT